MATEFTTHKEERMHTKTTFNLGDNKPWVMSIGAALALIAAVTALDNTNTLMPLANWFGLRGFAGMPFVLALAYCMHRAPAWITPMPKWLGRVIHGAFAVIIVYLLLALVSVLAVGSALIDGFLF